MPSDHGSILEHHGVSAASWLQMKDLNSQAPECANYCIHDAIHKTAIRQPDATAICAFDGTLTYVELEELVTRLSHWLITQGIGPGTHVPLCFEKSIWAIVCMLAVVKVGAAFVPLDPDAPIPRLQSMLKALDTRFIIASPSTYSIIEDNLDALVLIVGAELIGKLEPAPKSEAPAASPGDVAFVMYTSGKIEARRGSQNPTHNVFRINNWSTQRRADRA